MGRIPSTALMRKHLSHEGDTMTIEDIEDEEIGCTCKAGQPKKVSLVSLAGLKKHFDEVVLERTDVCNVLTLRDKCNKKDLDWIVWLQVKIPFVHHNSHSGHSDEQYVEGVCKDILTWVDLLKNFDKSQKEVKQLSLFDDESDEMGLEPLPNSPTDSKDGSWSKYFKERERISIANLKKQYTFFELCDLVSQWHCYYEQHIKESWLRQLPKNNTEMIKLVKDAIVKATSSEKGYGRFDDFWWDDEYKYLTRDGALSDIELIARARILIRLYLVPYKEYFHVSTDLSFSSWEMEERTSHRFWFDGKKIHGCGWLRDDELPQYDLYDEDFIVWLRNYFNIPHKEVISDDDILRENIKFIFQRAFRVAEFDPFHEIKVAHSFGQFKAKALSCANFNSGGGSCYSIDGFIGTYSLSCGRKGIALYVKQDVEQRLKLGRSIDELPSSQYDNNMVYVYSLTFDQVLEKAYSLFKVTARQTTLFDFLVA